MKNAVKLLLVAGFGIGLFEGVIVPETVGSGGIATSWTLTLDEGKNYWIAPPELPDPVQNITDAASLEQAMRDQIDPNLTLEVARYIPYSSSFNGGARSAFECYPFGSTIQPLSSTSLPGEYCWRTTDDLTWGPREGLHIRYSTPSGIASGEFTWSGVEITPLEVESRPRGMILYAPSVPPAKPEGLDSGKDLFEWYLMYWVEKLYPRTESFQVYTWGGSNFPIVDGEAYRSIATTKIVHGDVERSPSVGAATGLGGRRLKSVGSTVFPVFTDDSGEFRYYEYGTTTTTTVIASDGESFDPPDVTCASVSGCWNLQFTRIPVPEDLGVELYSRYEDGSATACPGDVFQLCARYRNLGDLVLPNAEVRLQLPESSTAQWLKYNTTTPACTFPPANLVAAPDASNSFIWDIGGIAPDEQCTVCAKVKATAPAGALLTATASGYLDFPVQDSVVGPDSLNSATWTGSATCRQSTGDVSVEPACGVSNAIAAGDTVRVHLRFSNESTEPIQDLSVVQLLDPSFRFPTLRVVDSSHRLTRVRTNPLRVVQFQFDDIDLEPGGSGSVLYEIEIEPGVPAGLLAHASAGVLTTSTAMPTDEYLHRVSEDVDSDSVLDPCDNCPTSFNPGQGDLDGDGLGNVCDPDIDGDGFDNGVDTCPQGFNPGQAAVGFGQAIVASSREIFSWPQPVDVVFGRGSLSQLKFFPDFVILASSQGTSFVNDSASPSSGNGFYYLARLGFNCSLSSWQTEPLGSQAPRDAFLP